MTDDAPIVPQSDADCKAFATLQAEAAFQGVELIALPDGRYILCRRGWCRLMRSLPDVARYLSKGWIV